VFVRDPQTGKVIGGLQGRSEFGLIYVAWFFLPEDWRRARIGSRVLAMAEEEGRRRGCTRIALTTLSIEAPASTRNRVTMSRPQSTARRLAHAL
jgi:GNAT superfamily N-acetyltransferase